MKKLPLRVMAVAIYLGGNSGLRGQAWWDGQRMKKLLLLVMAGVMVGCKIPKPDFADTIIISPLAMLKAVLYIIGAILAAWFVFSAFKGGREWLNDSPARWLYRLLRRIPNPFRKRGHDDKANQYDKMTVPCIKCGGQTGVLDMEAGLGSPQRLAPIVELRKEVIKVLNHRHASTNPPPC